MLKRTPLFESHQKLNGRLIEFGDTRNVFTNPSDPQTEAYVSGRFG